MLTATEGWDGTSWSELNPLATARNNMGYAGSSTANIAVGGYDNPGVAGSTEIWDDPVIAIKTVTVS